MVFKVHAICALNARADYMSRGLHNNQAGASGIAARGVGAA